MRLILVDEIGMKQGKLVELADLPSGKYHLDFANGHAKATYWNTKLEDIPSKLSMLENIGTVYVAPSRQIKVEDITI